MVLLRGARPCASKQLLAGEDIDRSSGLPGGSQ